MRRKPVRKLILCPLCLGNRKLAGSGSVLGNAAPVSCPECGGVGSVTSAQAEAIQQRMATDQNRAVAASRAARRLFPRE